MTALRALILALLGRFGAELRFPVLFAFAAGLFALDMILPDFLPFFDEIVLALATTMLASWKREPAEQRELSEPIDVTDSVERMDE